VKCSQRAPSQHRQVARASQRLTGLWRPQRHVQMAFRDRTVVLPLSALESRAATPPGRQRAASSASGRTIAGRSSDLIRTLFHPRKGWSAPAAGATGLGGALAALLARGTATVAVFGAAFGRKRRTSSGLGARPGDRYSYVKVRVDARVAVCNGLCYSLQPIYLH
jgi:hypothetical protein